MQHRRIQRVLAFRRPERLSHPRGSARTQRNPVSFLQMKFRQSAGAARLKDRERVRIQELVAKMPSEGTELQTMLAAGNKETRAGKLEATDSCLVAILRWPRASFLRRARLESSHKKRCITNASTKPFVA